MKNIFISLFPDPPVGFEHKTPAQHDLLAYRVALLSDSVEAAVSLFAAFTDRVTGLLITPAGQFSYTQIGPELWHLTVPEVMFPSLHAMATCFLDLIVQKQRPPEPRAQRPAEPPKNDRAALRAARQTIAAARHENEERHRLLVENQTDLVVKIDTTGKFLFVSPSYCRLFDKREAELLGKAFFRPFVHEDDHETTRKAIEALNTPPHTSYLEQRAMTKDGWQWLGWMNTGILDEKGELTAIIGVGRNINPQKIAEARLAESERKYRAIFNATSDALSIHDKTGRIHDVNEQMCKMFGFNRAVLSELDLGLLSQGDPPYSAAEATEKILRAIEEGPQIFEWHSRRADGTLFWSEIALRATKIGEQTRVIASVRNINQRKQTKAALENRIIALTQPLDDAQSVSFEDLFNLEAIQRLQDDFANATGVASIITQTNGTPITQPSNFCRLCNGIIRATEKGRTNCFRSDARIGRFDASGPTIQPCLSGGLWDAGSAITVGGKHIANWLIGQVRDETQTEEKMRAYAREIEADEETVIKAFREVTAMSHKQFTQISQALYTLANQLSTTAYQNVQQARFITERKQAEQELQHLRNYLTNIIDSMPSVLIGVNTIGEITQWNTHAQQVTGISTAEALGQPLQKAYPQLVAEIENVSRAIQTRQVQQNPKSARQEADGIVYEDVTIYPLIANGIEGAVIRVDDVTARVRIEEMIVQSEKMLSVGGLAAGMAHEINNPLAGMMQTANVMYNRLSQDIPANLKAAEAAGTSMPAIRAFMDSRDIPRMLAAITTSGNRVAEIVDNMLSFARRSNAQISTHDITKLLDRVLELAATDYDLKKQYDFKTIEISKVYETNLPDIPCEGGKIQQVLLNILRNGAQAMQDKKPNTKHQKPRFILRVSHEKKTDMIRLEIEDNGPGMDEATRKRVFEPFFTTKPVGEGTGLGLSVSYFIITENHGGTLDVVSEPGKGSNFIIRLPINKTRRKQTSA